MPTWTGSRRTGARADGGGVKGDGAARRAISRQRESAAREARQSADRPTVGVHFSHRRVRATPRRCEGPRCVIFRSRARCTARSIAPVTNPRSRPIPDASRVAARAHGARAPLYPAAWLSASMAFGSERCAAERDPDLGSTAARVALRNRSGSGRPESGPARELLRLQDARRSVDRIIASRRWRLVRVETLRAFACRVIVLPFVDPVEPRAPRCGHTRQCCTARLVVRAAARHFGCEFLLHCECSWWPCGGDTSSRASRSSRRRPGRSFDAWLSVAANF